MSDAQDIAERFARSDADPDGAEDRAGRRRWFSEPLLPEAGAGGAPLTAVIAVMSFLAALALAAFLYIAEAASEWTRDLRSEVTIQVKGADREEIAQDAAAAMRILADTEGVLETRLLSPEESARLLEPWLGRGNVSEFLNVPALIEVRMSGELRRDLDLLRNRLAAAAPGAVLDDHGRWHERLSSAARSGQALAFFVFALIMAAACAISIFAARAGLAANSEIVAILHLVGATDDFIASQVQRRFLVIGLRGSIAGLALAVLALGLAAMAMRAGGGAAADFFPTLTLGPGLIAMLLAVPLILCLVTAFTARMTVMRALAREL